MKRAKLIKMLGSASLGAALVLGTVACSSEADNNKSSVKNEVKKSSKEAIAKAKKSQIKLSQSEALNKFDKKYEGAKVNEIDLELENNKYVYVIEGFDKSKSKEYELKIKASNGDEVSSKSDKLDLDEHLQKSLDFDSVISRDEASKVAEKEAKGTAAEWKLKLDDDKPVWEVQVDNGNKKTEVKIDAKNKKILEKETDD